MSSITTNHIPTTAPAAAAPRLRITSRGRTVLATLVAIPVAVIAVVVGFAPGAVATDSPVDASSTSFAYVTIEPGQSLWQVAEKVAPQADPREVIADILALNNLSSSQVQPGQDLALPTQYAS